MAFESEASNLVEGDTNNVSDILVSTFLPTVRVSPSMVSKGNSATDDAGISTDNDDVFGTILPGTLSFTSAAYGALEGIATAKLHSAEVAEPT